MHVRASSSTSIHGHLIMVHRGHLLVLKVLIRHLGMLGVDHKVYRLRQLLVNLCMRVRNLTYRQKILPSHIMDSSATLPHVVVGIESGLAHVRWLLNMLLVVVGTRVKLLYLRLFYLIIEWIIQRVKIFRIIVHVLKLSRDAQLLRSLGHIILILQVHIHVLVLWLGWRPLTILLLLQEVVLESAIHLGVRRAHPLLALWIRTRVRSHIFGFAR